GALQFRVFNKRTRRVEENLHVEFLENKAIEKGTKDAVSQEVKKDVSSLRYIALPNWAHDALLEFPSSKPQDHCSTEVLKDSGNSNPTASTSTPPADQMETLIMETPIPTVSSPVPTTYSTDSQEPLSDARLISKRVANQEETPSLDNILSLSNRFEDILGVTSNSDESNGVEADISNMETAITASPTPTIRIHKDHPKSQIIGPVDAPIQTRNKSKQKLCRKSFFNSKSRMFGLWLIVLKGNKARLVAQGHTQEEGIDYDEVFAPVARIEAIRLFLAYASFMGFTMFQMDVKSTFLYGTIDEEVLPEPGMKEDGIFLSQDKYVGDILKKFGYSDVRSSNTPMDNENPWGKDGTRKDVDLHLYKSMIGSLMYLTASRPDIMFTTIIATSTTEAEYVAAASCCGQVLWIQNQLLDYGDCFEKKLINVDHIHTDENVADLLTKPLDAGRFKYLVCKPFPLLGKLSTVSVFLGFGLTIAG
nr:ribonuclease H-like domain-containing protein [Tanacetum cinerariifolium]